jgi:hypothetical protein
MVAYSFKRQFIEPILAGTKAQTIREPRRGWRAAAGLSGHARPGEGLQLFVGMRTKSCELILRTICLYTSPVTLMWRPIVEVKVDDERLSAQKLDAFARRDGFADFDAMEVFWAETHPGKTVFHGEVIRWQAPSSPVEMGATVAMPAPAKTREAA